MSGAEDRGRLSRRGLMDILGRGVRGLREGLEETARVAVPGAAPLGPAPVRVERPPGECGVARPDGFDATRYDRDPASIEVGASVCLRGEHLAEPLVLVHVDEHHWAAATGECPVDGSDLLWAAEEDRLLCPACKSRWRLDGEPAAGPARARLESLDVQREPDGLRISRW
jgi:hypothetical protein